MYEVVITYRPNFREYPLPEHFATWEEAYEKAQEMALRHRDKVIRAWVRTVKDSQTKSHRDPV